MEAKKLYQLNAKIKIQDQINTQHEGKRQRVIDLQNIFKSLTSFEEILNYFQNNHIVENIGILNLAELHTSDLLKIKKSLHINEQKKSLKSIYYGEVNKNRNGCGIMLYSNGRIYEGEWLNDVKFGKGFELYPSGNYYLGNFVNGKQGGMGKYVWDNGEVYEGMWLDAMKHGQGVWNGTKGESYQGDWRFSKADGYGLYKQINGDIYQGQFKQCLKHGEGIEYFSNGDYYQGSYTNGLFNGYGEYYWSNQNFYKGYYKNGFRCGIGVSEMGKDDCIEIYEGQYRNDKKCGLGICKWNNGDVYRGQFQDDVMHGNGEMRQNGNQFKGSWEAGIFIEKTLEHSQKELDQINIDFQNMWNEGLQKKQQESNTLIQQQSENIWDKGLQKKESGISNLQQSGRQSHIRSITQFTQTDATQLTQYPAQDESDLLGLSSLRKMVANSFSKDSKEDSKLDKKIILPNIKYNSIIVVDKFKKKNKNKILPYIKDNSEILLNSLSPNKTSSKTYKKKKKKRYFSKEKEVTQNTLQISFHRPMVFQPQIQTQRNRDTFFEYLKSPNVSRILFKNDNKYQQTTQELEETFLDKHEIILWNKIKQKHPPNHFKKFTHIQMKEYIHPTNWRPPGVKQLYKKNINDSSKF